MSRFALLVSSLGVLALAGCSVTSTGLPSGSSGSTDDGSAVSTQALTGTIAGKPFTAVTAIRDSFGSVNIYDYATTCAEQKQPASGDVGILLSPSSWTDGTAWELSFSNSVTFVQYPAENYISDSGRVEIVSAGDANTPGQLRIRATADNANVEGQVPVLNCTE